MHLILLNPNTNDTTTAAMVRIAQDQAGQRARIEGRTAPFGAALITSPATLDLAEHAIGAMAPGLAGAGGVIVAAFGDPGLDALRAGLRCHVTGIAEAGMAEAAAGGRRFAVVTTTPDLRVRIAQTAARHGHAGFVGTWVTPGDPVSLMSDPQALLAALDAACRAAIDEGGAQALVIGGGPLAMAARALAGRLPVPLIEPVPAAVRLALARGLCRMTP
jgi:allantoin racemase